MKRVDSFNPANDEAKDLKLADRSVKTHITQMHTVNNNMNTTPTPSGPTSPVIDGKFATLDTKSRMNGRFMTVTDSYFDRNRLNNSKITQNDIEQLKNHYKFHKGTTYAIGNLGEKKAQSTSLAKESFVAKQRQASEGPLPGRYNQE